MVELDGPRCIWMGYRGSVYMRCRGRKVHRLCGIDWSQPDGKRVDHGRRIIAITADAEHELEKGLKKELRLRDLVPMQILLMVGVSWAGIAAKQGSTHPTIWIFGILVFFLPQAMVVRYCVPAVADRGRRLPVGEVSLGPLAGFLSAWNYGVYAIFLIRRLAF